MKRLLLVVVAALFLAPDASAKVCVRIATIPAKPAAGEAVTIRVTALSIVMSNGRARPGDKLIPLPPRMQMNIRVVAPDGTTRMVRTLRTPDRRSVLEGTFTFPLAGEWTLSWAAWANDSNPACAGKKRVLVRDR